MIQIPPNNIFPVEHILQKSESNVGSDPWHPSLGTHFCVVILDILCSFPLTPPVISGTNFLSDGPNCNKKCLCNHKIVGEMRGVSGTARRLSDVASGGWSASVNLNIKSNNYKMKRGNWNGQTWITVPKLNIYDFSWIWNRRRWLLGQLAHQGNRVHRS